MSNSNNTAAPTVSEVRALASEGELTEKHTSRRRGYTSRKGSGYVENYSGKFGKGFAVITPCFDSSQYVFVTYFVHP